MKGLQFAGRCMIKLLVVVDGDGGKVIERNIVSDKNQSLMNRPHYHSYKPP